MEFKVGDKVRFKKANYNNEKSYVGKVGELKIISKITQNCAVAFEDGITITCSKLDIELISPPKKSWKDFQNEKENRYKTWLKFGYTSEFGLFEAHCNTFNIGDEIEFKNGNKYKIEMTQKCSSSEESMYTFYLKSEEIMDTLTYSINEDDIPKYINHIGDYDFTDNKSIEFNRKLDELQNMIDELRKEL